MVNNQNIEAIEVLSDAMQTMVNKKMENVARDRTRIGMVRNVNANGTFKILVDGKEYDNIQSYGDADIVLYQMVKVIYPDNNPTNMYILPPTLLATTTRNGLILANDRGKLDNILYDADNVLTITVGSGKMFSTIQSAIDSLPKDLGHVDVTIAIDAGTYAEDVNVINFNGSKLLTILGAGTTGNPTTIIKTIYCEYSNVVINLTNLKCNNTRVWSGTDTYAVGLQGCKQFGLENLVVTSTPTASFVLGNSFVNNAGNCKSGAGTYGVRVRHNSGFYAASTCDWSLSTKDVRSEFGGQYSSSVLVTQARMDDEYGGAIVTDGGMKGLYYFFTTANTYCTNELVLRFYPHLGMCMVSGYVVVKSTPAFPANTNVTVANTSTAPDEALPNNTRPLSCFLTGSIIIECYISAAGNIGIRANGVVPAGTTMQVNGAYLIKDATATSGL